MIKTGDRVSKAAIPNVFGKVVNTDCAPTIIVEYSDGQREKVLASELIVVQDNAIRLTPEKYDETVKALMYATAKDVGDSEDLDQVLEIIGAVCSQLKARLFGEND